MDADFHFSWIHVVLNLTSAATVLAAITAILPAITATVGLVYWSVMLYRLLKKKE